MDNKLSDREFRPRPDLYGLWLTVRKTLMNGEHKTGLFFLYHLMSLAAFRKTILSKIDLHHNFSPVKDVFRFFDFYDSYFRNESFSENQLFFPTCKGPLPRAIDE